jgi:ABC-type glycerol-3-phosphate transport system substrate-binding protein
MRKLFALALMALALASFAVGCGKKAEETTPAATETSTMSNDSTAAMGGGMDSTSAMAADSTKAKH